MIGKYFVPAHVTVQEHEGKAALNDPGGQTLLVKVGGDPETSLPFFAFLDEHGALIVNSAPPGPGKPGSRNIGYPGQPSEIDWFLAMVRKAAPAITRDEAGVLERYLRAPKK